MSENPRASHGIERDCSGEGLLLCCGSENRGRAGGGGGIVLAELEAYCMDFKEFRYTGRGSKPSQVAIVRLSESQCMLGVPLASVRSDSWVTASSLLRSDAKI